MPVELVIPKRPRLVAGAVSHFPVNTVMSLDPAVSDKKRSDASGIIVNCVDPEGHWWIFEADAFRGQPMEVCQRVMLYVMKYHPSVLSIEKVGAQILYRDLLYPMLDDAGVYCQIVEYTEAQRIGKHARISALQPLFRQGRVHIRSGLDRLVYELEHYAGPNSLDHEDLIDSLAQHIPIARAPMKQAVEREDWGLEEVAPSKRAERERYGGDPLDGTFTGGPLTYAE
jgi:phage terminase large subunit-like protein